MQESREAGKPASLVSEALVVWTGWRDLAWPSRDEDRVVRQFGRAEAELLMPQVRAWADDFYASDAHIHAPTLVEMGDRAEAEFRLRHPEASDEAVRALAWCYTFDFK